MTDCALDTMRFKGPWRPALFGEHREQQLFMSLAHWYEAARFDERVHPERYQEILLQATARECMLAAKRYTSDWRTDWQVVRPRVLQQGLWLCHLQNRDDPIWSLDAAALSASLLAHGIEERFLPDVVAHFKATLQAPRVLVLGAATAPPKEVGRRINALHRRLAEQWVLVHWMGRHVSWEVHDWADSRRLPIFSWGVTDDRLARDRIPKLLDLADQVLVFEKRGGKAMDKVIKAARAVGKPLDVALWSDDTVSPLPEVLGITPRKTSAAERIVPTGDLFGDS